MELTHVTIFFMKYTLLIYFVFSMTNQFFTSSYSLKETIEQNKGQVVALCYHNIRQNTGREDLLFISEALLDQQMKFLFDNGYHAVSPDQLLRHFSIGDTLPLKPIIISFDDTHEEHYSIAKQILEKYGFKGVFFVMTVSINKRNYMTAAQIKELSDSGHTIGAHTWDHPDLTTLMNKDWELQVDQPKQELKEITAKAVESFAYPFGAWNEHVIAELKKAGLKSLFSLRVNRVPTNH